MSSQERANQTQDIQSEVSAIVPRSDDVLLHHVQDLLKQGYKVKTSTDQNSGLQSLTIDDGHNSYEVDQEAGNRLFVSHKADGKRVDGEELTDGNVNAKYTYDDNHTHVDHLDIDGKRKNEYDYTFYPSGTIEHYRDYDKNGNVVGSGDSFTDKQGRSTFGTDSKD